MDNLGIIRNELDQASEVLNQFLNDPGLLRKIETASEIISSSFHSGGKVLSCGNGGSHCDAMHFAEELTGKFRDERKPFPAISISDPSYITCVGNDYGFEHVFSRYIEGIGREGDVLLVLSTSGNSENILNALDTANAKGMKTIALTGKDGGLFYAEKLLIEETPEGDGPPEIIDPGKVGRITSVHPEEIGRASCRERCRSRWSPYH